MDPATIIGTTSAILSFVQFTGSVILTAKKIHDSAHGATIENQTFQDTVTNFRQKYQALETNLSKLTSDSTKVSGLESDAKEELIESVRRCIALGTQIHALLDKVKASTKPDDKKQPSRLRGLFRTGSKKDSSHKPTSVALTWAALKTVWKEDQINALRKEWESCMVQFQNAIMRFETAEYFNIIHEVVKRNAMELSSIHELVETLVQQLNRPNFDSLWSVLDEVKNADSDENLRKRNCDCILKALEFQGMDARRKQVKESAEGTFEWCVTDDSIPEDGHPDLEISFRKWLATGDGVYHITGKPGSGKSTLMKLIDRAEETQSQLQEWATRTNKTLIRASFYTWKAADSSPLQNQIEGLERTLLYDILSHAPQLTPMVFPKHWDPESFKLVNVITHSGPTSRGNDFDPKEVHDALESIIETHGPAASLCLFFLIDGLDEFGNTHEHSDLAKRIQSWGSSRTTGIKICVSSREETAFMNNFSAKQRLRLHLVTREDVRVLTEGSLMKHDHFASFPDENRESLIDRIVGRAEGVFFWVVLTIGELKLLLDDQQEFQALEKCLKSFPTELNDFFREVMSRIPNSYHDEARAVLAVAAILLDDLIDGADFNLFYYSMLHKCLGAGGPTTQMTSEEMSLDEAITQTEKFTARFPSMCRGLLEMQPMKTYALLPVDPDFPAARYKLVFTHRSAFDFIQEQSGRLTPLNSDIPFDGIELFLLSAYKTVDSLPWDGDGTPRYENYLHLINVAVILLRDERDTCDEPYFGYLKALEVALLRKQQAIPANRPFESLGADDIRLTGDTLSVFHGALRIEYTSYVGWALKSYPQWFTTNEAKSWAVRKCFYESEIDQAWSEDLIRLQVLRCAAETGWIAINETIEGDQHILPHFSPPLLGSAWLHYMLYCILSCSDDKRLTPRSWSGDVRQMLESGAEPRIRFAWWSAELSPEWQKQVQQHCEERRRNGPRELCWVEALHDLPLGVDFGLRITVGDDPETTQLIQGPQWPEEQDTCLIRGFVTNFGQASGSATLREVLELSLTPTEAYERRDGPECLGKGETLQALDDAVVRAEAQSRQQEWEEEAAQSQMKGHNEGQHGFIAIRDNPLVLKSTLLHVLHVLGRYPSVVLPSLGFVLALVIGYLFDIWG